MTPVELERFAYGIARRMWIAGQVPEPATVEDVAQAALVSALEAQGRYDQSKGASFKTFVAYRIKGAIRDEVDRHMRLYVRESYEALEDVHLAPGHYETPERHALGYEALMSLAKALNRLTDREQSVFEMYYREDLFLHEIGSRLGVSEARAGQILNGITRKLREQTPRWMA